MSITLDIKKGDVILTGKFRNKKVTVKEIGTDEYGLPTVNGKGIMKIRVEKFMPKKKVKEMKSSIKQIIKEELKIVLKEAFSIDDMFKVLYSYGSAVKVADANNFKKNATPADKIHFEKLYRELRANYGTQTWHAIVTFIKEKGSAIKESEEHQTDETYTYKGKKYYIWVDDEHNRFIKVNGRIVDIDNESLKEAKYNIKHTTQGRYILNPDKKVYDAIKSNPGRQSDAIKLQVAVMLGNPREKLYGMQALPDGSIKIG